jgi:hypothetical protein
MGPEVREGAIVTVGSDLIKQLLPGRAIRWELSDFDIGKRLWTILVEDSGSYQSVGAAGEFRTEIIQGCGVDASRFSVVGFGLGLERLAMIRYGINDIRTIQPAI